MGILRKPPSWCAPGDEKQLLFPFSPISHVEQIHQYTIVLRMVKKPIGIVGGDCKNLCCQGGARIKADSRPITEGEIGSLRWLYPGDPGDIMPA